jgi:hypothetical protein
VSLGLYFDEHVHRAIATGLRLRGVDVQLHASIGRCVNDLELIAKVCSPADLVGRVEFLPL